MTVDERILTGLREGRAIYLRTHARLSPGRRLTLECGGVEVEVEVCAPSAGVDLQGLHQVLVRLAPEVTHG